MLMQDECVPYSTLETNSTSSAKKRDILYVFLFRELGDIHI